MDKQEAEENLLLITGMIAVSETLANFPKFPNGKKVSAVLTDVINAIRKNFQ